MHIKRIIIVQMIILILFNIFGNFFVYAETTSSDAATSSSGGTKTTSSYTGPSEILQNERKSGEWENVGTEKDFNDHLNSVAQTGTDYEKDGKTFAKMQDAKSEAVGAAQDSGVAAFLGTVLDWITYFLTAMFNWPIRLITGDTSSSFQIEKTIFNEYQIFNIDFFSSSTESGGLTGFTEGLKKQVGIWYYNFRTIALVASVAVLVYIALRMAISTVAEEKTKYKEMLKNWVKSLVMVFVLHYVLIFAINIANSMLNALKGLKGDIHIEESIRQNLLSWQTSGWASLGKAIMQFTLTYFQFKFFVIYFRRTIISAFLISISPLITITYSINKAGDNPTTAFNNWKKEMISIVFMQPLHALLYIVFVISAGTIAEYSPFIALILLWSMSKGEGMLRSMLKLNGSDNIKSLEETRLRFGMMQNDPHNINVA